MPIKYPLILIAIFFLFSPTELEAIQMNSPSPDTEQKHLDINDLDRWETLVGSSTISDNGKWLAYGVRRNSRDRELRVHDLTTEKITTYKEAGGHRFSPDNRWLGFLVSPDAKTVDKLRADKKPTPTKLTLVDLTNSQSVMVENVESFSFSGDGRFVAMKKAPPAESKLKTFNLVVRELSSGRDQLFGNVKEFNWKEDGSLLAVVVDASDKIGNSISLFDGRSGAVRILDAKEAVYSGLTWRSESDDLAVRRSVEEKGYEGTSNDILIWRGLLTGNSTPKIFVASSYPNFKTGVKVSDSGNLQWSSNGDRLFFGVQEWKKKVEKSEANDTKDAKAKESTADKEIPALEIWNASDVTTIAEQKANTRAETDLSVWNIDANTYVPLGSGDILVRFQNDSPVLLAVDEKPYEFEGMFGRTGGDVYSIDVTNGARKKILSNNRVALSNAVSPGGRYFVYIKDNNYHVYELATGKDTDLTAKIEEPFVDLDDDHPVPQKAPFGFVGWNKAGTYFVVHGKYNIWKFDAASGKGTRLTEGENGKQINRFMRDRSVDRYVDLDASYFVRRFGEMDKRSGYLFHDKGQTTELFYGEGHVFSVDKAEKADTFVLRIESYNDSPDYFVKEGGKGLKQVSNINPFEKEFKSGKAELVQYTNAKGQNLQGSLYYPDDYVPGKKYPMITYIYELLTNGFHSHSVPSNTNYYSRRVFTSQGYFVFMPDIVFEPGDPGVSSVRTLEAAVNAVVVKGDVDEKRVGLVGHSWGGYQAAFAVTGTNIFAAVVAGAGISNLVTMYGTLTPSFGGQFESKHFEVGQERMLLPPWKDIDGYLRNSAIPNISRMQTPLLMEVGDADRNVNWGQGLEMYNAARREKKPMVLLVYANEGHGLSEPKNQKDYQKRILEWFAHYLKGEPANRWIKDNISFKEQQELLKEQKLED